MMKNIRPLPNDLILTGIPRSGTSYLCGLLHNIEDCVAINEPDRMSGTLRKNKYPQAALDFHNTTRKLILQKEPIQNKLAGGKFIEDTAVLEQYETYQPQINRADFLLCTKNTLGYLARLEGFKETTPYTPIIVCIRNPIDTIASWMQSFPHLETASAAAQHIIGALNDEHISSWQRERLLKISKETRIEYKRALFWSYLADWIWKNKSTLTLVYYEDIVTKPRDVLFEIFNASHSKFDFKLREDINPSNIRNHKRNLLTVKDMDAISEICFPAAKRFAYKNLL